WFCGGTLISNSLVLTAAHCLYSDMYVFTSSTLNFSIIIIFVSGAVNVVRLGELDFAIQTNNADPEDFGVQNTTEHTDFKYPELYNDIALIQLNRIVRFNAYKRPVCLPVDNGDRVDNFIATGWGDTKLAGRASTRLLKVELNNYGNACSTARDIEELPNGFNQSTQLCLGSSEHKDTCNGDSGGPVFRYNGHRPCKYYVMGITSIGIGCGEPDVPTIYTRVHFYLDWIRQ
ncbi:CG18420, partial [Drosophila busckii]